MADRLIAEILPITASALETWRRCRREYRSRHLLGVAPSDEGPSPDFGNRVHAFLRLVHESGSCRDAAHVGEVLAAHGVEGPGPVLACIERHARRCPSPADSGAHEVELARFHRQPAPMFMVTGRIDAVWIHDGLLDARDYKTGRRHHERLEEDPSARLQAWLLGRHATRRRLQLRLRYEYLSPEVDEDPEPFDPDDDDLELIEHELHERVLEIDSERSFVGIADEAACRWCRYRSICPDSAAPSEPTWPAPPDVDAERDGGDLG
jgi:hypothetical protein